MALFVQLDVNWPENGKVARVGIDGAGLHAVAMCIAKRTETDGWIDHYVLARYASPDLVDRLVKHGLLDAEGDRVRPSDWLDRNPSQGAIDASRASKREAGKAGNHRRYGHPGPIADCRKCNPPAQVVAGCESETSHPPRTDLANASPDTESETETTSPPTPRAEPGQVRLQAVAAVAVVEAGTRGTDGAYCRGIRKEILDGVDGRLQRIETELAAGKSPEDIAASWTTAAPDPLLGWSPGRPIAEPPRPPLTEFHGFDHDDAAPTDVARSAIAAARGRTEP